MSIPLESIPRFDADEALEIGRSVYGIEASVASLPSERDQNFLLSDPVRGRFVLKIANRDDGAALLEFQHGALKRVARTHCRARVPQVIVSLRRREIESVYSADGVRHHVRVLSYLDGTLLAQLRAREGELFESIGACLAQVDRALDGYAHPAMHRPLQWDLRQAGLARPHAASVPPPWRTCVEAALEQCERIDWSALRHGVIHGDANDYNVLVDATSMTGLLDFGDMLHSARVCDLAIALAYVMLDEAAPLEAAARAVRGYHAIAPLDDAEQHALWPLINARLAISLCYSAHNRARNPEDPYQVISERPVRALIERLHGCDFNAASAQLKGGCTPG